MCSFSTVDHSNFAIAKAQERNPARIAQGQPPVEHPLRIIVSIATLLHSFPSTHNGLGPPPDRTRVWHDRSGQFRVEAAFLGFVNGKLRLHKVNGVIVEVPSEKMSVEDMQYVEKLTSKRSRPPSKQMSDDDVPLALSRDSTVLKPNGSRIVPKVSKIDWFDFFLSAGCDLDDCTRYAASFERDKIDESILPDITDATMRSLGLREGDIIRVTKAIEKRKPADNLTKPNVYAEEQVRRDEELARHLQAQETGGSARSPAPNLFSGPGGVLKNPRRGRPQPSKSLPPSTVDLKAISTVSEQISRTASPASAHPSTPVQPPARSSSAIPVASGFDDDAWTVRPSSTKPIIGTPPVNPSRAPSAPPTTASTATTATTVITTTVPTAPTVQPSPAPAVSASPIQSSPQSLAKATELDIFNQLSRLSELRNRPTSALAPPTSRSAPPVNIQNSSAPAPLSQFTQAPSATPQPYTGPRGPFAPVPANQGLLQPLIPTQTGFNSFIPTRPTLTSSFSGPQPQPSFLTAQPTGIITQPTGIFNTQPLMSQPTGIPSGNFSPAPYQNPFGPVQTRMLTLCISSQLQLTTCLEYTGFNPNANQPLFNAALSAPPPVPPLPPAPNPPQFASNLNNTSPANIFAQMKSGTFAADSNDMRAQSAGTLSPFSSLNR